MACRVETGSGNSRLGGAACGTSPLEGGHHYRGCSTIEPPGGWLTNWRTIIPKKFNTTAKVLGPMTDFTTWGSSKWTANLQGIWLWRSAGFDYRTSTELRKQRLLEGTNKPLCTLEPRRKEQWPHKRLSQTCLCVLAVSGRGMGQQCPAEGSAALTTTVLGGLCVEGGCHYCHCPYHRMASGQTTGRENSPTHQQKRNN